MLPPPPAPHQLLAGICLHPPKRCSGRGVSCRVTTILPHDIVTAVPSPLISACRTPPRPTHQLSPLGVFQKLFSSPLCPFSCPSRVQPQQISVDRRDSPIGTKKSTCASIPLRLAVAALFTLDHPKPRDSGNRFETPRITANTTEHPRPTHRRDIHLSVCLSVSRPPWPPSARGPRPS